MNVTQMKIFHMKTSTCPFVGTNASPADTEGPAYWVLASFYATSLVTTFPILLSNKIGCHEIQNFFLSGYLEDTKNKINSVQKLT